MKIKTLGKRLSYYATGLVIGIIFVLIVFGERACTWLPGNRVKEDIIAKVIVFPEDQIAGLKEQGITQDNIYSLIINGKINFKESIKIPTEYPKAYVIELNDSTGLKKVQFSLYEDSYITIVHPLQKEETAQSFQQLEGWGKMVKLPKDSSLVYIDNSEYTQCKATPLPRSYPDDIVVDLKNSGKIDFSNSDLMLPKAKLAVSFLQNDTLEINAETIWYKHRITFKDFFWKEKLPCEEE